MIVYTTKMLDEHRFKSLSVLKDDPGFKNLDWFTYFKHKKLKKINVRNLA